MLNHSEDNELYGIIPILLATFMRASWYYAGCTGGICDASSSFEVRVSATYCEWPDSSDCT